MKTKIIILTVLCIGVAILSSCETESKDAPEIPPYETMNVDFSKFDNSMKSSQTADLLLTNYQNASITVGVWNLILTVNLAVPVMSFYHSFSKTPVFLGDAKWQWKYDVKVLGATYQARMTGQVRSEDVKWEMYLSREGIEGFSEFLWYEGTSSLDNKSGQWNLYHSNVYPERYLQIDWEKPGVDVAQVTYKYVRQKNNEGQTDTFNGSYLTYGKQSGDLDLYYNVHAYDNYKNKFLDTEIEWSSTEYNGHIKAEHIYSDTDWHCWDSEGANVDCE